MNKILLFLALTLAVCACKNDQNVQVPDSKNEDFVRQYFSYFNQHDWQKFASQYADTAEFKDPSLGPGIVKQTHQQIIEKYSALQQIFPDIKDTVVKIYPAGAKNLVVEFISTGTAGDGTKFELPICTILTFENGKITQDFTYYDNME